MEEKINDLSVLIEEQVMKSPNLSNNEKTSQIEILKKILIQNIPLKDALNINDETIEFLYSQGYRHFQMKKFRQAIDSFQLLFLLKPTEARFSLGIAASYQMLKEHSEALQWYLFVSNIDESPLPIYHASNCLLQMNEREMAIAALKSVIEKSGDQPNFAMLKERAIRMLENIQKDIDKKE